MFKSSLRKIYLEKRLQLSSDERIRLSERILLHFKSFEFPNNINVAMAYLPMEKMGEFNPLKMVEYLQQLFPTIQICYPKIQGDNMEAEIMDGENAVTKLNKFGTRELANGKIINPKNIDLIIMPLLIFDLHGNRVGYGKGFYDRFLQKCKADVISLGCSFFDSVDIIEDISMHDIPMKYCITPNKVYRF